MSIAALIEAVEAGTIPRHDLDAFIPVLGLTMEANNALDAYRSSLDAARALHDALLPDWYLLDLGELPNRDVKKWVAVVRPREEDETTRSVVERDNDPARAWLLAILRAKEAGQ